MNKYKIKVTKKIKKNFRKNFIIAIVALIGRK